MRGVRGVRVGALLVALGLMVAACGGGDDEGDAGAGGDTADAKKVGLVYDIGGRGDQSFNDSAGAGLDAAKQEQAGKIEVKEIEPNADGSNRKELLDSLADEGYGLNFGVGFLFSEDIAKSATESPDTHLRGDRRLRRQLPRGGQEPASASASRRRKAPSWSGRRPPSRPSPTRSASSAASEGGPHQEVPGRLRGGRQVHRRPGGQGRQGPGRLRRQHPRGLPQPGQGQGAGPEADRRGCRRHLPRLRRAPGPGSSRPPPPSRSTPSGSTPTRA